MRNLREGCSAMVDLGVVLMVGIAFAALTRKANVFRGANGDSIYHMDSRRPIRCYR